jgi:hypothetical protein
MRDLPQLYTNRCSEERTCRTSHSMLAAGAVATCKGTPSPPRDEKDSQRQELQTPPTARQRSTPWRSLDIHPIVPFVFLFFLQEPALHSSKIAPPERASIMPENRKCECTSQAHGHPNNQCENPAIHVDGLCEECHSKKAAVAQQGETARWPPPGGRRI